MSCSEPIEGVSIIVMFGCQFPMFGLFLIGVGCGMVVLSIQHDHIDIDLAEIGDQFGQLVGIEPIIGVEVKEVLTDCEFCAVVPRAAMTAILLVDDADDAWILLLIHFGKDSRVVWCAVIDDHDVK